MLLCIRFTCIESMCWVSGAWPMCEAEASAGWTSSEPSDLQPKAHSAAHLACFANRLYGESSSSLTAVYNAYMHVSLYTYIYILYIYIIYIYNIYIYIIYIFIINILDYIIYLLFCYFAIYTSPLNTGGMLLHWLAFIQSSTSALPCGPQWSAVCSTEPSYEAFSFCGKAASNIVA